MQQDLNLIRLFAVVARNESFSAAAKETKQPVSSVARAMSKLERELGVLLVQRGPRGISLTDEGAEYLHTCTHVLRRLTIANEAIRQHRGSPRGTLRVMAPITTTHSVLIPILPEFLQCHPELEVQIQPYTSNWDAEPGDEIDIHFKVREPRDTGRHVRLYPATRRGLFASRRFIQKFGTPKSPEELKSVSCVGYDPWVLRSGGVTIRAVTQFRVNCPDPLVFLRLVLSDVGVGCLPLDLALQPEVEKQLVRVLPDWEPSSVPHCALYFGPARLTPKVELFLRHVEKFFGTERDPRLKKLLPEGLFEPVMKQFT